MDIAIGNIITEVAVLEIHMDKNAVATIPRELVNLGGIAGPEPYADFGMPMDQLGALPLELLPLPIE